MQRRRTILWIAAVGGCSVGMPVQSAAGSIGFHGAKSIEPEEGDKLVMAEMPPEQNYDAIMTREFRSAVQANSSRALIRFIARHPNHPLAEQARRLLSGRQSVEPPLAGDPDADVIVAFDAARRSGDAAALLAFAARYSGHPLAEEARRMIGRSNPRRSSE
jgi:hypothetical protein